MSGSVAWIAAELAAGRTVRLTLPTEDAAFAAIPALRRSIHPVRARFARAANLVLVHPA